MYRRENYLFAFYSCQAWKEDTMFMPLDNSRIGLFSLKTMKTEVDLNPSCLPDLKSLGQVMAIKPFMDETNYVLVAYDGGQISLWDMRSKKILSSLEVEPCPMSFDFNTVANLGVIGNPSSNLDVSSCETNLFI